VNGKMTEGFAFVAYPAEYRSSGVMTFIVSQDGVVYQKDVGTKTEALGKAMQEYISNDAGRVKSFCSGSSIVRAHHNLLRNLRSCSADDSPQLPIFIHVQPTSLGPVLLHRFGVAPPNISSVTMDHDDLFKLPAIQGGG
jgi:hypothetical protein